MDTGRFMINNTYTSLVRTVFQRLPTPLPLSVFETVVHNYVQLLIPAGFSDR